MTLSAHCEYSPTVNISVQQRDNVVYSVRKNVIYRTEMHTKRKLYLNFHHFLISFHMYNAQSIPTRGLSNHQQYICHLRPIQRERPTQLNSTQLEKKLKIAQFFTSHEVLNIFRTGWVELSWVESGALNMPKTAQNWLRPNLQLLTNSSLHRLGISSVTYFPT